MIITVQFDLTNPKHKQMHEDLFLNEILRNKEKLLTDKIKDVSLENAKLKDEIDVLKYQLSKK